jgi:serine/threonine protein phosphatase 1
LQLMLRFLRSIFTPDDDLSGPAIPPGQRIYAVGDVHGCDALFAALIAAIEADDAAAPLAYTTVILLGDLVDRGPDSAGVVRRARAWQGRRRVRILLGNHEEMFLGSFTSTDTMRHFLRHGGKQTLASFGLDPKVIVSADLEDLQALMQQMVPKAEREYLAGFEDMIRIGDYVFVHAGVEPEIALADQSATTLRWIREPFLSHAEPHEAVVVHGHTISEAPEDRGNRIGVDTGAYASGRLTALVLEGTARRYIEAVQHPDGTIATRGRALA